MKKLIFFLIIFLSSALYLNFLFLNSLQSYNDIGITLLIVVFNIYCLCINRFQINSINKFEIIALLFFSYIIIKILFLDKYKLTDIVNILVYIQFYFSIKGISNTDRKEIFITLERTIYILLALYLFVTGVIFFSNESVLISYPNNSIFSVLLAGQLLFVICNNKRKSVLQIVLILFSVLLLIYTKGRAGWIGFIGGIFYYIIKKYRIRKWNFLAISIIVAIVLGFIFFLKSNSTYGRILIYKISLNAFKENKFLGIGFQEFKTEYNNYQARYFEKNSIDNAEAMLADNTYYAFNEFYQLIIETGIVGMLLLSIALFFLLKKISKNQNPRIVSVITCLLLSSLFNYSFHFLPVLVLLIVLIAAINYQPNIKENITRLEKIIKPTLILISLFSYFFCLSSINQYYKFSLAKAKSNLGMNNEALKIYKELDDTFIKRGDILKDYSKVLLETNRIIEGKEKVEEAKKYLNDQNIYLLSAKINYENNLLSNAEHDLIKAVCIVPHKMNARHLLFNYYYNENNKGKIIFWGNSIINMPIKVENPKAYIMRENVRFKLSEIMK